VEKVRINPGNYADKKRFNELTYTEAEYQNELERIYKKFAPLVKICKEYGTAMRIGTNHGSLSDRIMSHYGDTPQGMVESAMEFIRMCEDMKYYNLVISMKSSNPQVMVQAYRLLVQKMHAEGMHYPLHLGVTEAGDGEDGRIKSAVGIGTLLEDGLGDTIRVSLTEEPELEIPVAKALVNRYTKRAQQGILSDTLDEISIERKNITSYEKRKTDEVNAFIGGSMVPRIIADISKENLKDPFILTAVGYRYDALLDKFHMGDQSVDFVYLADQLPSFIMPANLKQVYDYSVWRAIQDKTNKHPLYALADFISTSERDPALNLVYVSHTDLERGLFDQMPLDKTVVLVLKTDKKHGMADQRSFITALQASDIKTPVIIKRSYAPDLFQGRKGDLTDPEEPLSKLQVYA